MQIVFIGLLLMRFVNLTMMWGEMKGDELSRAKLTAATFTHLSGSAVRAHSFTSRYDDDLFRYTHSGFRFTQLIPKTVLPQQIRAQEGDKNPVWQIQTQIRTSKVFAVLSLNIQPDIQI